MPDHLTTQLADGVLSLTFDRPEARNALSLEMRAALRTALLEAEDDAAVRAVVLTGAGDHFMAGGDVKQFYTMLDLPKAELKRLFLLRIQELHTLVHALQSLSKPVVASVRGAAAGAGVSLALACDLVIAADDAYFTLAYCHIGTTPDGSGTFTLPRAVGVKKAMELALLGERIDARDALAHGMINFVVPATALANETGKLARRLAQGPTHVYANTKRLIYRSLDNQLEAQLMAEAESFADCASRDDFAEGVRAFVEKRKARFTGH